MTRQTLLTRLEAVCGEVTIQLDREQINRSEAEELATKGYIRVLREACPDGIFAVSVKVGRFLNDWAFTPEVIPYNDAAEQYLSLMGFEQPYRDDQEGFDPARGWMTV